MFAVVAVIGSPAIAAPPEDTFELFYSPDLVTQGDVIEVRGTCWTWTSGAPQEAFVSAYRRPEGPGAAAFDFYASFSVSRDDGSWSGRVRVPVEAPSGRYNLALSCTTQDQSFGSATGTFVVEGTPAVTTATTTSTPPQPGPPTTAQSADAVESEATFTG